jgi:DNA-binding beta-propeller fold protein YncE
MAGTAGIAVVADDAGKVTLFIADFYNGRVRAVAPDGIIRDVSEGRSDGFEAPTRVAYASKGGWLYVADSSNDRVVALNIPKIAPNLVRARPVQSGAPPKKAG